MTREAIATSKRIVVKIGSSSLSSREGGLDLARLRTFVDAIADHRRDGLTVTSGADRAPDKDGAAGRARCQHRCRGVPTGG